MTSDSVRMPQVGHAHAHIAWARRAARLAARLWIAGSATPVHVHGAMPPASAARPCVLVANHASILDALVLTAVLPPSFAFVAESELARVAWLRLPLRRLGAGGSPP